MPSQKKLNTYGVESPCERFPGVGEERAYPLAIRSTTPTALQCKIIFKIQLIENKEVTFLVKLNR